jgi:FixJ family two-component response regulator
MQRVALVDDDPDVLDAMRDALEMTQLAVCVPARSLAELQSHRAEVLQCSLAILDVNLGHGRPSGVEVFHWLRDEGFAGDVVFLTGHAADHPRVMAAMRLGSARVLSKPVALADLEQLVGGV